MIRRSISAARSASISCPTTAVASASQGHGLRSGRWLGSRRISGPSSGSRRKRRWKSREVVVDAEREAHPLQPQPQLRGPRQARLGCGGERGRHCARVERLGPQLQPPRPRFPGPDQHRAAIDVEEAGGDPGADPQRAVGAAAPQPVGRGGPYFGFHGLAAEQMDVDQEGAAGDDVGTVGTAPNHPPRRARLRPDRGRPRAPRRRSRRRPARRRRRRSRQFAPRGAGPAAPSGRAPRRSSAAAAPARSPRPPRRLPRRRPRRPSRNRSPLRL